MKESEESLRKEPLLKGEKKESLLTQDATSI